MFVSAAGRNFLHNTGAPPTPNRSSRQNSHGASSLVQLRDDVTCRVTREFSWLQDCLYLLVRLIVVCLHNRWFNAFTYTQPGTEDISEVLLPHTCILFYFVPQNRKKHLFSPRLRDNYCHF